MIKENKQDRYKRQRISYGFNESRNNFEKDLRHLDNTRKFDGNMFVKGEEWYNSGLSFDSADPELKNNLSFIKGYNKGVRMDMIRNNIKKSR